MKEAPGLYNEPFALFFLETGLLPYVVWALAIAFIPMVLFFPAAVAGGFKVGYAFFLIYLAADLLAFVCLCAAMLYEIVLVPLFLVSPLTLAVGILLWMQFQAYQNN